MLIWLLILARIHFRTAPTAAAAPQATAESSEPAQYSLTVNGKEYYLAFEGNSEVFWFEGNFSEYEDNRHDRLGVEADQPHRIKYKRLTRN